jgi:hypothetical protein
MILFVVTMITPLCRPKEPSWKYDLARFYCQKTYVHSAALGTAFGKNKEADSAESVGRMNDRFFRGQGVCDVGHASLGGSGLCGSHAVGGRLAGACG